MPEQSVLGIVAALGPLWPLVLLDAVGVSLLSVSFPYVVQNAFARNHADLDPNIIQCDVTPTAAYCENAVMDINAWKTSMSYIGFIIKFFLAPTLGVLSDSVGRRPVFVTCCMMQLLPFTAILLHTNCGLSIYCALLSSIASDLPLLGLMLAYSADRMEDPESRMVGFGLIVASSHANGLVTMSLSSAFSPKTGTNLGCAVLCLNVAYITLLLPESLPKERRRPLQKSLMWPTSSLRILLRNRFLTCLSICLLLSGLVDSAENFFGPPFCQKFLGMDKTQFTEVAIVGKASLLFWSSLGIQALHRWCGDVGTLALAQICGLIMCLGIILVSSVQQLLILKGVGFGIKMLTFPATSALKSNYVSQDEQGQVQGALTAVVSMTSDLAPMLLDPIFQGMNGSDDRLASSFVWALCALLQTSSLSVVLTLPPFGPLGSKAAEDVE